MNTQVRAFTIISTITLFGLASPAMAVVNWYNSSAADNSGGATVPIDGTTTTPSGWVDTQLSERFPDRTQGGLSGTQMNGSAQFVNTDANMMVYSFGALGIANADDVISASLHLSYSAVNTNQTFTIWGLTGTVDNSLTWNNAQTRTGFDPNNPSGTSYGSFTADSSAASASATSIDLTAAIKAYIDGTITGIVIGTTANGGLTNGSDNFVTFHSSETTNTALRPSLMVDFVPEPSTYALVFGLVALVGVVRRRKNRRSSIPMPA